MWRFARPAWLSLLLEITVASSPAVLALEMDAPNMVEATYGSSQNLVGGASGGGDGKVVEAKVEESSG